MRNYPYTVFSSYYCLHHYYYRHSVYYEGKEIKLQTRKFHQHGSYCKRIREASSNSSLVCCIHVRTNNLEKGWIHFCSLQLWIKEKNSLDSLDLNDSQSMTSTTLNFKQWRHRKFTPLSFPRGYGTLQLIKKKSLEIHDQRQCFVMSKRQTSSRDLMFQISDMAK